MFNDQSAFLKNNNNKESELEEEKIITDEKEK